MSCIDAPKGEILFVLFLPSRKLTVMSNVLLLTVSMPHVKLKCSDDFVVPESLHLSSKIILKSEIQLLVFGVHSYK